MEIMHSSHEASCNVSCELMLQLQHLVATCGGVMWEMNTAHFTGSNQCTNKSEH